MTAYAEPAGGGERVWYLDNELTTSSNLPDAALGFAVKGARIGSEHVVGEYRGRILLTTRPITRDEAKTLTAGEGIEASASFDLTVTP